MPTEAAPVAPTNGAPEAPKADPAAELSKREAAIADREKKFQAELRKNADDKKGLGAKLSRLSELEKKEAEWTRREQLAKLNPPKYLESLYGEKWQDTINTAAIHGVPPADLIKGELMSFKEEVMNLLKQRDDQAKEQQTAAQTQAQEESRAEMRYRAQEFLTQSGKDYPIFDAPGIKDSIAQMLARRVEDEYVKSYDATTRRGKLLSVKEAADLVEADLLAVVDTAAAGEKYKPRLQEKLKPATVVPSSGVPKASELSGSPRRTLSNALTASTPEGKPKHRTEADRMAAAQAAFNAARNKG